MITITGNNFNDASIVEFNGINAAFTIVNDNEITVLVPSGIMVSTANISITSNGGCSGNSATDFIYIISECNTSTNNEIYISEVYDSDGGSYGVIELYNPTNNVITLDGVYQIDRYGDIGNVTPSYSILLTGSINPLDTFIIEMGSTGNTCSGLSSDLNQGAGINANDEIVLLKNSSAIDVMHTDVNIGYTFTRNSDAVAPSTTFDISEWMFSDTEDCSDLDMHSEDTIMPPNITQPNPQIVCENSTTTFSVSVDTGTYNYQWNVLDASGNWMNITNDAIYSGATTNTLTLNNIPANFNENQYYCEITSTSCDLTSIAVQLQVLSPEVDTIANQTVCSDYTLPALTNGNYFTSTNGSGTQLNAGDIISTSQTIFIYNEVGTPPDTCSNESSFTVTVSGTPPVDTIANQTVCSDYTLPTLTNGNYFTGTNGSGTQLNAGDIISTSQTIFIYNEVGTAPDTCSNESSFSVTVSGTPPVDTIANQTVCSDYTLLALTNGNYFTGTNGSGTQLNAGDIISTSQTIFIYNEVGTAPNICSNESSFTVTVSGTPPVDTIANQTVCSDYTLPALTNGNYFTGTNGSGTQLNAGEVISATQTIFIYNEVGIAPDTCSNESSFTVTVSGTPLVDTIANQTVCSDYTLPALTNGNYFTGTNGSGTQLNAGEVISATQTIFIYNEVGIAPDTCSNESSFTVTVSGTPLVDTIANQTVCSDYTLPALTNGNYFTGTNGSGTQLNAGEVISATQTIFIYNEVGTPPDACSNESSFTITISATPLVDTIANQDVCTDYTLPNLTNGNYFTGTNGSGTQLNAGDIIATSQTIFIYNEVGTAPDTCANESSFSVTVSGTPPVDTIANQTVCSDYTLLALTNGNYFTGTNGSGTQLNAGDIISTSQTIFIYNEVGTAPNICSNESSFTVTVSGTPPVDTIANQTVCSDYTLPALTNGNYFTGTNGSGIQLNAGDVISTTQTIFIYNEVGTAPNICSNESSFSVTVSGTPLVDTIANQTVCSDYTLPALTNGNYFTGTNGSGIQLNAGDVISTTQTIFIYNEVGTAPDICSNESSFSITINTSTDFTLSESDIDILNGTITVSMSDQTLNYEYSINNVNFQTSPVFSNLPVGFYTLYVREIGGCITKHIVFEINIDLFIPKFFTPNGDTFKDTWKIIDRNNVIEEVFIFDRYGKLLKHVLGNAVYWDGTYNGKALEANDYWYLINLRNGQQLKGHFALKR